MGPMPENIDTWEVRADQRYLYHAVVAVNNGRCDDDFSFDKPGPVSTARWLTTASRVLRLYMAKKNPDQKLKDCANFIVKVYAPFWFLVKSLPHAIHGSRHMFKYICWTRQLPNHIQAIIRPTIKNNAYYCHPENIVMAMITDESQVTRENGYEKIRAARDSPSSSLRRFFIPKEEFINFDCTDYVNMIDWNLVNTTEPPVTQFILDSDLVKYQYSNSDIIQLPGNIQQYIDTLYSKTVN